MRTRHTARRGPRGSLSSSQRSSNRLEERLEVQAANSKTNDRSCDCGETNLVSEEVCDTCGDSIDSNS